MSETDERGVRPKSTAAQWWTLAAVVVFGVAATLSVVLMATLSLAFISNLEFNEGGDRVLKEAACVPYVTGVLSLTDQGYTPAQIEAAYLLAAAPPEGDTWTDSEDASIAMSLCGSPADVVKAATG